MSGTILEVWGFTAHENVSATVIPDGCQDLIGIQSPNQRARWIVSSLDTETRKVDIRKGEVLSGFRLKPGTRIDVDKLIKAVQGTDLADSRVMDRLEAFSALDLSVSEALSCLGSGPASVAEAAKILGVRMRTLQRTVSKATGWPPVLWSQLARARRAGRAVALGGRIAEVAYAHGYSDQPHMNREFMRWFSVSPLQLKKGSVQGTQLFEPGFA